MINSAPWLRTFITFTRDHPCKTPSLTSASAEDESSADSESDYVPLPPAGMAVDYPT